MAVYIREASIRKLMERSGIDTQAELARRCNMTPIGLNRLIKNRRRGMHSATIDKLCRELNAQPGDFLYYEPDPMG